MENLAHYIAEKIGETLDFKEEKVEVIAYGMYGLLQSVFLLLSIAVLGLLTDTLLQALTALIGGAVLRKQAGGSHANSPMSCNIISIITCLLIALLSTYLLGDLNKSLLFSIMIVVYLASLTVVIIKAPVDSPNKRITSVETLKKLKIYSVTVVVVFLIISMFAIIYSPGVLTQCAISLCLATLWQTATLTTHGSSVLKNIDFWLTKSFGKGR